MRVIPNLAQEFEEICAEYNAHDQASKDIVTLVKMFGNEYDDLTSEFEKPWADFLEDHQHQATVKMIGMVIYLLLTYWENGQLLFGDLPLLEKMLLRDTFQDISDEIERRSAANGDAVIPG
jgi:hypothetical protein